jgi:hypothetical protein
MKVLGFDPPLDLQSHEFAAKLVGDGQPLEPAGDLGVALRPGNRRGSKVVMR